MTGYDPTSYGQIKLGNQGGERRDTPDDILFEDAGPMAEATFGVEEESSDWGPPEQSGDPRLDSLSGASPEAFHEEPPREHPQLARPKPSPTPRRNSDPRKAGGECVAGEGRPSLPVRCPTKPLSRRPRRRPLRFLGAVIPPVIFSAGAGGAAWFYQVEQNVVMAGIVAATGLIGAVFTRLLFK